MGSDKTLDTASPRTPLSFKLFLIFAFVLLGRPQDVITALQPLRPALVFAALGLLALFFGKERSNMQAALKSPESKRYLFIFLMMIVGIPFAVHRRIAFEGVFLTGFILNIFFFVLLVSQISSLQRLKSFIWVITLCTLTYSLFGGLFQNEHVAGGRFNLGGRMFDANDTAFVLVSMFPFALYFIRFNEGFLKRALAIIAVLTAIAAILLTGSRGGLLGLGAILVVFLLSKDSGIGKGYKFLIILMLASTAFFLRDSLDIERYETLTDISSDYNVSDKGGRMELWKGALALTFRNPLTGVGVECYTFAHFLLKVKLGETYLRYHSLHNSYLQISSEVGLIGFGLFVLLIVQSLVTFRNAARIPTASGDRESSEIKALGSFMLLGLVGLLVTGMFLTQGYSVFFPLYFGLGLAMRRLVQSRNDIADGSKSSPRRRNWVSEKGVAESPDSLAYDHGGRSRPRAIWANKD